MHMTSVGTLEPTSTASDLVTDILAFINQMQHLLMMQECHEKGAWHPAFKLLLVWNIKKDKKKKEHLFVCLAEMDK